MGDVAKRLEHLLGLLEGEVDILQVEKRIRGRVKRQMEKSQREYYLNEQVKAIQKELGEGEEGADIEELDRKIKAARMPKQARQKAEAELKKLKLMSPMSAEATVVRNYIDTLIGLPWKKKSKINNDLANAQKVLDEDHYGLEKVKDRIVEYLAVQQRVDRLKAPILCLVGPPGVGKTSLGQSIARATGRKFARASLGGVHDEAEIRGHRRTYIGALPGSIIQSIRKAETNNPVFMLDEIDKLGAGGFHGDPASALLEVLDPEQNATFHDNYLAVAFDLSKVMFIATANVLETIPGPLRDRMEVIQLPGYTQEEKLQIARRYLVARQLESNGLKPEQIEIADDTLRAIIADYTREAGVRSLEREIGAVLRSVAVRVAEGAAERVRVAPDDLPAILGPRRFENEVAMRAGVPGVATGLAWTPVGGDILFIEASKVPGSGRLILTGQLGDVMKESAQAALSLVKARLVSFGLREDLLEKSDVHVHVPAGATPKDGPSAGVSITMALTSLLTGRPVRSDTAMTGEISLRGLVLPVGGIKEKVLAAQRAGISRVLLPARNRRDFEEIPEETRGALEFVWLETVDDAIGAALGVSPVTLSRAPAVNG
jgi:ATP-dependent Lon protease